MTEREREGGREEDFHRWNGVVRSVWIVRVKKVEFTVHRLCGNNAGPAFKRNCHS